MSVEWLLKPETLPAGLPVERAIKLDLIEGIPVFRTSRTIQTRIESLLQKQKESFLDNDEFQELDRYEELNDYLNFVNRTIRNIYLSSN